MQRVKVVLTDGKECTVSKDELQFLLTTKRALFFERSNGWIVCGRDSDHMRHHKTREYSGYDRREHKIYATDG